MSVHDISIQSQALLNVKDSKKAGRELKFISLSMSACFTLGAIVLLLVTNGGYGLPGCWYGLVGFQWARFFLALQCLISPDSILYSDNLSQFELEKLKAA